MQPVEAADYLDLASVSDPQLSSDGERVAFVQRVTAAERRAGHDLEVDEDDQREPVATTTPWEPRLEATADGRHAYPRPDDPVTASASRRDFNTRT